MSLTVFQESKNLRKPKAGDLPIGTWFANEKDQIFVIVLDDRTHEKRIVCLSQFFKPFIANVPPRKYSVNRVLDVGTLLQVSTCLKDGGQNAE